LATIVTSRRNTPHDTILTRQFSVAFDSIMPFLAYTLETRTITNKERDTGETTGLGRWVFSLSDSTGFARERSPRVPVGLALLVVPGIRGHFRCLKVSKDTLMGRKRRRAEKCKHLSREITARNHSRGDIYSILPCAFVNLPPVWYPIRSLICTTQEAILAVKSLEINRTR
jgi:hypothetical protein